MALKTVNGAGGEAGNPFLKALGLQWVVSPESCDIETVDDAWIDTATGFPGTNSVKASLSPAATVIEKGTNASWNGTTDQLTIGSTTGLSAGDKLYLSHAGITDGIYEIATVVDGTKVTLTEDLGVDLTGITYQAAWRYDSDSGTAPWSSSAGGQLNYIKSQLDDGLNDTQTEDTIYIRDSDARVVELNNGGDNSMTGQTVNAAPVALGICTNWVADGGVEYIGMGNHSVQAVNNFYWDAGRTDQGEKAIATAESGGLYLSANDGIKYGRLLLRAKTGSAKQVGVDISITLDTAGPTIVHYLEAR